MRVGMAYTDARETGAAIAPRTLVAVPVAAQASQGPGRPVITFGSSSTAEGAALAGGSAAQFAFTYNRAPKQTRTVTCVLWGPTASSGCDTLAGAKGGSSSGASYSGLANGSYTFTVTVTLTDGGTFSAVRDFTVAGATLTWTTPFTCGGSCWGALTGTGLMPGATITTYATIGGSEEAGTAVADSNGNVSFPGNFSCGFGWSDVYSVSTTASGATITSNVVNSPCG